MSTGAVYLLRIQKFQSVGCALACRSSRLILALVVMQICKYNATNRLLCEAGSVGGFPDDTNLLVLWARATAERIAVSPTKLHYIQSELAAPEDGAQLREMCLQL